MSLKYYFLLKELDHKKITNNLQEKCRNEALKCSINQHLSFKINTRGLIFMRLEDLDPILHRSYFIGYCQYNINDTQLLTKSLQCEYFKELKSQCDYHKNTLM